MKHSGTSNVGNGFNPWNFDPPQLSPKLCVRDQPFDEPLHDVDVGQGTLRQIARDKVATASTENAHRHHAAADISFSLSGVYARQITPFFLQAIDIDHGCAVLEASFYVDDLSELRKLIGSNKSDSAGRNA